MILIRNPVETTYSRAHLSWRPRATSPAPTHAFLGPLCVLVLSAPRPGLSRSQRRRAMFLLCPFSYNSEISTDSEPPLHRSPRKRAPRRRIAKARLAKRIEYKWKWDLIFLYLIKSQNMFFLNIILYSFLLQWNEGRIWPSENEKIWKRFPWGMRVNPVKRLPRNPNYY